MAKIAVVTGGAGFIGSHVVDLLIGYDYEVRVIDNLVGGRLENLSQHKENRKITVLEKDIRELDIDNKLFSGVDEVYHFAGIGDIVPSIEHPQEYMDVNLGGTIKVLEAARQSNIGKLVYAASSSCYGLAQTPTDEEHIIDPQYPYALSKYQGEQAVMHWSKVYKMYASSVRIFNAFGTRSRTSGAYGAVFGVFLKQKLENKPLTIVGDGSQTRDFLYVTDVAKAFHAVVQKGHSGECYNLGAASPKSVNYLASLLSNNFEYIPKRPGEPECTWANINKLQAHTGWEPEVSFEDGVERIIGEIEYWRGAPLWDKAKIKEATETWFKYLS